VGEKPNGKSQITMNSLNRSLFRDLRCAAGVILLTASGLRADVKMPSIFGSHMVLQQDTKIPVWGWAAPGEEVTVTLGGSTAKATAEANGNWRADLPPAKTESKPQTLTVAGKNTIKFDDVLVGDVWVCSGQSNMQFSLSHAHNAATELPKADDPQLRLFAVVGKTAMEPQCDVPGKWVVCTPETVATFSAVGYFFAKELRPILKRPIGLIGVYWGGTMAQAWTSLPGLQKDPPFANYVAAHAKVEADFAKRNAAFPGLVDAYRVANKKWTAEDAPAYNVAISQWKQEADKAKAANQTPPPAPTPAHPKPAAPAYPDGGQNSPANLFNGMVAPLIPYAIKGVIWYQGESNQGREVEYATLFPRMITDWREKWSSDFPFLFVQLAAFGTGPGPGWARLRESQTKALALPKTGMAIAIDVGDPPNIHPKDKFDVGHRLALAARHVAYGEDLVYSGPMYDSMKVEGGNVVLSFKNTGSGMIIDAPPWVATGDVPPPAAELKGFVIAGENKKWFPAAAKIDGDTVVVSSPDVPKPVAVRYAWENSPVCNLYNKEHLPASPFRTDDW